MHHFCTLFDSNYLTRALVMYHSLMKMGGDFKLYVVCFDDLAYQILIKLELENIIAIPLVEFESIDLLEVKKFRNTAEYCWTCTPHVIRYVLDNYKLSSVTYLDADLCFYDRPSLLLTEFEASGGSVLITEHRYTPCYDQSATSGIYCVQFVTFKADKIGMKVLQWWQDRCVEWCYARFEDGKFGDQKYLDDWTTRFEGVHVLNHIGGGVAPWNIQQYDLRKHHQKLWVNDSPLIFYHFHNYKKYTDGTHYLGDYELNDKVVDLLYRSYARNFIAAQEQVFPFCSLMNLGCTVRTMSWKTRLRRLIRLPKNIPNEYKEL